MDTSPPFAPPYKTITATADGVSAIETRADGSKHEVEAGPIISYHSTIAPDTPVGATGKQAGSGKSKAKLFLDVPFSEKDDAKALGARWDPKARRWYVPDGIDAQLFSRWK
jgi:hypothetical protein